MGNLSGLLPIILIVAVFYFLIIRPQSRQRRQHQQLISSIEPGDEVLTIGGMFGVVRALDDAEVRLEVADGTVIRLSRGAISRKIWPDEPEELEGSEGSEEAGGSTDSKG
jgi:preprotein translocase subunit YajC